MEQVKEAPHQRITRKPDDPKLEIGEAIAISEGVIGVVLARFIPSGKKMDQVYYIVELRPNKTAKEK